MFVVKTGSDLEEFKKFQWKEQSKETQLKRKLGKQQLHTGANTGFATLAPLEY